MEHNSEAFIGIDTSKLKNAIAIAEGGRDGEVRYLGEIETTDAATRKLVKKLATKYRKVTFCYEGRTDRLRPVSPDHKPWPRMQRGGAVVGSQEAWRPREDQPSRCGRAGQEPARRRTDCGVGARYAA